MRHCEVIETLRSRYYLSHGNKGKENLQAKVVMQYLLTLAIKEDAFSGYVKWQCMFYFENLTFRFKIYKISRKCIIYVGDI